MELILPLHLAKCQASWSAFVVEYRFRSVILWCGWLHAYLHAHDDLDFLPQFPLSRLQRMKSEDFIRNLRGIDNNRDLDEEMLTGIYERIRNQEFRPGNIVYLQRWGIAGMSWILLVKELPG